MSDEVPPVEGGDDGARAAGRRRTRRVLIGVLAVVGILAVGTFAAWQAVDLRIGREITWLGDPFASLSSRPPVPPADGASTPVNILFLGSDSRISGGDPGAWLAGAQRSDAILLVHFPSYREEAFIMSIPRDSWVTIPGHGEGPLNTAYALGGPSLMIETVEQLTDIHIDHVAVVDFQSFAALTDMFGGVDVTIPDTTYDTRRLATIPAGTYHMDGQEALAYVRQSDGLPGGYEDRARRQQNWLRAIALSAIERGALDDPAELTRILLTVSTHAATDEEFTLDAQRELAYSLRGIGREQDLNFFTAPVLGVRTGPDGTRSGVTLDEELFGPLCRAIAEDRVEDLLDNHPDRYPVLGGTVN